MNLKNDLLRLAGGETGCSLRMFLISSPAQGSQTPFPALLVPAGWAGAQPGIRLLSQDPDSTVQVQLSPKLLRHHMPPTSARNFPRVSVSQRS